MQRRVQMPPFTVTVPKDEREKGLGARLLKEEGPQILQWMIEGAADWRRVGLAPPDAVIAATKAYFAAQDSFSAWLEECCKRDPNAWTPTTTLFTSWKAFAERTGVRYGDVTSFGDMLEAVGFRWKHSNKGNGYEGLCIASEPPW
jgi:putative DNA primase/helicase